MTPLSINIFISKILITLENLSNQLIEQIEAMFEELYVSFKPLYLCVFATCFAVFVLKLSFRIFSCDSRSSASLCLNLDLDEDEDNSETDENGETTRDDIDEWEEQQESKPSATETVNSANLWYCPYCEGANKEPDVTCTHCGAARKIS